MTCPTRKRGPEDGEEQEAQSASKFLRKVHECQICHEKLDSGQALGGHMTKHRSSGMQEEVKSKLTRRANHNFKNPESVGDDPTPGLASRKVYECQICHENLDMAQALGGHMTRHWSSSMQGKVKFESSKQKTVSGDLIIFNTELICGEKFVEDELRSDSPTLVTRDFFQLEPLQVQAIPLHIQPILEENDLDLDLKVGLPGRSK